jgi:hypothetical protein
MMTRSVGLTLSWEYWRRGMVWFVPAVVLLSLTFAGVGWTIKSRLGGLADFSRELQGALVAFLLALPLLLAWASVNALRRQFVLPLRTRTLVGWSLVNGAAATAGAYLSVALVCNYLWRAGWPLLGPGWLAVAGYTVAQAAAWWAGESRVRVLALFALWLVSVDGLFQLLERFYQHTGLPGRGVVGGPGLTWCICAGSLGLVAAAYLAAVVCISRDRCGERWTGAWLRHRWPFARAAQTAKRAEDALRRTFRSPATAQFWLEWRSKGRYVPLSVTGAAAGLWILFAVLRRPECDVTATLGGLTGVLVFTSPFVGVFLGSTSSRFDLGPFLATRPLSDRALASAVLRSVAASVGSAALVWFLGLLATMFTWAPRFGQESCQELWREALGQPNIFWAVALGQSGLVLLIVWTLTSLGAALALTRSWFVPCGALGLLGSLLLLVLAGEVMRGVAAVTLALVLPALFLIGTVTAFVIVRCRELLSWPALLGCVSGYAVLLCVVWGTSVVREIGDAQVFIGLAALPFLPFAAAPLAVSWNRHR